MLLIAAVAEEAAEEAEGEEEEGGECGSNYTVHRPCSR